VSSFRDASKAITKSSHLMALHIVVSSSLLLSLPVIVCVLAGVDVHDNVIDLVVDIATAICTAGGVVIGASATRHTGEGYARAQASKAAIEALPAVEAQPPETRPGEEPYHG
jgi:hypothetical protein